MFLLVLYACLDIGCLFLKMYCVSQVKLYLYLHILLPHAPLRLRSYRKIWLFSNCCSKKIFHVICVTYPLSAMYECKDGTEFSVWHAPKGVWVWRPLGGGGDALSVCARFRKSWKRMWMWCTGVVSPLETPASELSCGTCL